MSSVIPDWMREQQRVEALLGPQANGYGSATPGYGANPYAPTGAPEPRINPNSGQFEDTYGYFDQGNVQKVTDYSVAMQEALARGDNAAYQQALNSYRQTTGGLQPPWSYNITPEQVQMNARNPGGVNAGQPASAQPTGPQLAPTPFSYGGQQSQAEAPRTIQAPSTSSRPSARPTRQAGLQPGNQETPIGPSSSDRPLSMAGTSVGGTNASEGGRVNQTPYGSAAGPIATRNLNRIATGPLESAPPSGPPSRNAPAPNPNGGNPIATRTPPRTIAPPDMGLTPPPAGQTPPRPPSTGIPTPPTRPTPGTPITPPPMGSTAAPPSRSVRDLFPAWSTWNNGNPYQEGDPGMMATSEQNRATDYGNLFEQDFGGAYRGAQGDAQRYGGMADTAYGDLYNNPGFNGDEAGMIQNGGIEGGLNSLRASDSQLDQNYLTPEEQSAIEGDPYGATRAFDPNTLNDLARTGTGATQTFFGQNYQKAQDALNSGSGRADAALGTYGANARGDLSTMRNDLYGAIDQNKLGISNDEVERMKSEGGRQVGFQYGAAIDDLQRKAEAAGNVSPLALTAARERLLRSQAVDSANAMNRIDLEARQAQRSAEQDISNRRIGVGTTVGQAGIGLEGDIANTGLNANQNMAALNAGTQATYGSLGTNLGLNTTKQLTDTANTAGQTAIQQAQYGDTNAANRAATLGTNRQNVNTNNLNTRFGQGMGTAAANSTNAATVGNARIAGQQAARNYWQGQNQFQGGQANAAAGQRVSGAQTSLSGQGQAGSTAVGNLNARRNPIQIGGIGFTL